MTVSLGFYTAIMAYVEWLSPYVLDCTRAFDPNPPFFSVLRSNLTPVSIAEVLACLQMILIWAFLNGKKASLSHQLHLYSNGHFYDAVTNKKHKSGSIPHSLHWGYLDPNYPLRRSLKGFWKFWIRGKGSDERRKWVLPAMSGKWILPVFDCRFGYHWGIVIFFFKHPRLSTAAKLRILTNEKIINSLLTLKSKSHGISRFFYWTEGVYILLCRVAI